MKSLIIAFIGLFNFVFFVPAQTNVSFFEEHIDFSLLNNYFTINGIYSFACKTGKNEVQQIIFPFDTETRSIDSIRILNLNTFENIEFKRLKKAVYFKITVPASDTIDLNIFYRQKISSSNKYVITSTQSWGEPLKTALYSLTTERDLEVKSFTYQPDTLKLINNQRVYLWAKYDFMPKVDFEILIKVK